MKRSEQATSSQNIFLCAWQIHKKENKSIPWYNQKKIKIIINEIRTFILISISEKIESFQ